MSQDGEKTGAWLGAVNSGAVAADSCVTAASSHLGVDDLSSQPPVETVGAGFQEGCSTKNIFLKYFC